MRPGAWVQTPATSLTTGEVLGTVPSLFFGFLFCEMKVMTQILLPRASCGWDETWHAKNVLIKCSEKEISNIFLKNILKVSFSLSSPAVPLAWVTAALSYKVKICTQVTFCSSSPWEQYL